MATAHSYKATVSNNKTENEAVSFLLAANNNFLPMNKEERKLILEKLNVKKSFSRAFDLIWIENRGDRQSIEHLKKKDIVLVELKTTKKKLLNNPSGFFFGATENEFALARRLKNQYRFCFVSLHPESKSFVLLKLGELERIIKTKRVQHQINL